MPYVANPDEKDGQVGTVIVKKIAGAIALYLNDEQIIEAHSQQTISQRLMET